MSNWVDEEHALRNDVTSLIEGIRAIRSAVGKNQARSFNKRIKSYRQRVGDLEHLMQREERQGNVTKGEHRRRMEAMTSLTNSVYRAEELLKERQRGGTHFDTSETAFTESMDSVQLLEHQQNEIERQNAKLDEVLTGVYDVKSLSYDQQKELGVHSALLGEIDRGMSKADMHLRTNTDNIDELDERSGGCWPQFLMIFLFALIVFLMLSNWACHIFNPKRC